MTSFTLHALSLITTSSTAFSNFDVTNDLLLQLQFLGEGVEATPLTAVPVSSQTSLFFHL